MIRTAIVGLGEVAGWHRRGLERTPGAELSAVVDTDESRRTETAAEWGVTGYPDLDELLADGEDETSIDWVHVCTPLATHYDLAMSCVEAGVPALVEKPFVATRTEFEELTRAADDAGVRVSVVHNQAYYRPFLAASRRVAAGEFGRLHGVTVEWAEEIDPRDADRGDWVLELPGGEFGEGIVHPIYVGLRAAGHPADEAAVAVHRIDTVDGVAYDGIGVSFTTAAGTICTIQHHSNVPDRRRVTFAAEGGHVTVDIATGSVRVQRNSYGPNATAASLAIAAAASGLAGAARSAYRAARTSLKERLLDDYSSHDTHTPVIRREARALREGGEGPTPRAEADWTNYVFTAVNECCW